MLEERFEIQGRVYGEDGSSEGGPPTIGLPVSGAAPSVIGSTSKLTDLRIDSGYGSTGRPEDQGELNTTTDTVNDELEETATVYSVAWSLPELEVETYKSEFAEALTKQVRRWTETPNDQFLHQIFKTVPRLLRAFALRLGHPGSKKAEKEVMYFIHKHRK